MIGNVHGWRCLAQPVLAVAAVGLIAVWTATGAVAAPVVAPPSPDNGPAAGGTLVTGTVPVFESVTGQGAPNGTAAFTITTDGSVWMMGSCGTTYQAPTLLPAPSGVVFTSVASYGWCLYGAAYGASDFYALASDGTIWGGRAGLSTGVWQQVATPAGVTFTGVGAGYLVGYGIASDGTVWAWGSDALDQFGDGLVTDSPTPVKVPLPSDRKFVAVSSQVSTGDSSTMLPATYALADDGSIWAWGGNENGQLGNGDMDYQTLPVQVQAPGVKFTAVATGVGIVYALDDAGNLWTWGAQADGSKSSVPIKITLPAGMTATAIAVGSFCNYLLAADGTVWSWGGVDSFGNIGTDAVPVGTYVPASDPVQVSTPPGMKFTAIAAGSRTGYALADDGSMYSWGLGLHGQLGTGARIVPGAKTPVPVTSPVVVNSVTFGGVPGTGLTQNGVGWSVTTPRGCGVVDVVVSYTLGTGEVLTYTDGFTYGAPAEITSMTSSQTGNLFTASVTVAGDDAPTVKWQQSYDDVTWTDVRGATGTTLTATVTKKTEFRAVATNCWTSVQSLVMADDPPPLPPVIPNHTAETGGSTTSDWAGLAVAAASLTITGSLTLGLWRRRRFVPIAAGPVF